MDKYKFHSTYEDFTKIFLNFTKKHPLGEQNRGKKLSKKFFEKALSNKKLVDRMTDGEQYVYKNIMFDVETVSKALPEQANIVELKNLLNKYPHIDAVDFVSDHIVIGGKKLIASTTLQKYLASNTTMSNPDNARAKALLKTLSTNRNLIAEVSSQASPDTFLTVSYRPMDFYMMGHNDIDKMACFANGGQSGLSKFYMSGMEDMFVVYLTEFEPYHDDIQQSNVYARAWGKMKANKNGDIDIYVFNMYPDGLKEHSAESRKSQNLEPHTLTIPICMADLASEVFGKNYFIHNSPPVTVPQESKNGLYTNGNGVLVSTRVEYSGLEANVKEPIFVPVYKPEDIFINSCSNCGHEDNIKKVNDQYICEECLKNIFYCAYCANAFTPNKKTYIIHEDIVGNHAPCCDRCAKHCLYEKCSSCERNIEVVHFTDDGEIKCMNCAIGEPVDMAVYEEYTFLKA